MGEKHLCPDDAAQYAQQIVAGQIRLSELGAVSSTANQELLVRRTMPVSDELQCYRSDQWELYMVNIAMISTSSVL